MVDRGAQLLSDAGAARSRFQVVSDGNPAWCHDGRRCYYFDGQRFWAIRSRDRRRLVVSWQSPNFGWTSQQPEACLAHGRSWPEAQSVA